MNLKIKNFGAIKNADIKVDGITVITGNNNTGKSTIGKIFYTFFNSFYDMETKIENSIKAKQQSVCIEELREALMSDQRLDGVPRQFIRIFTRRLTNKIIEDRENISREDIEKTILALSNRYLLKKEEIKLIEDLIVQVLNDKILREDYVIVDEIDLEKEIVARYFKSIFNDQINSLIDYETVAEIDVNIQKKNLNLIFKNNDCEEINGNLAILHQAFYLDDPFIADDLDKCFMESSFYENQQFLSIREHLIKNLSDLQVDFLNSLVDAVISKDRLAEIENLINEVIDGELVPDGDGLKLAQKKYIQPIKISNLSTGLKSFIIIKRLLELGNLRNKDVLIFDEPEIHLHPEWQIIYAQLIVLLQQKFDLTIIVTTHSLDFLDAIDYYTRYYKTNQKCNYYMSVEKEGGFEFQEIQEGLEQIYEKMVRPGLILDDLKYKLEDDE